MGKRMMVLLAFVAALLSVTSFGETCFFGLGGGMNHSIVVLNPEGRVQLPVETEGVYRNYYEFDADRLRETDDIRVEKVLLGCHSEYTVIDMERVDGGAWVCRGYYPLVFWVCGTANDGTRIYSMQLGTAKTRLWPMQTTFSKTKEEWRAEEYKVYFDVVT